MYFQCLVIPGPARVVLLIIINAEYIESQDAKRDKRSFQAFGDEIRATSPSEEKNDKSDRRKCRDIEKVRSKFNAFRCFSAFIYIVVKSAWYLISLTLYDRKDFEGCEPWALSLSDAIP